FGAGAVSWSARRTSRMTVAPRGNAVPAVGVSAATVSGGEPETSYTATRNPCAETAATASARARPSTSGTGLKASARPPRPAAGNPVGGRFGGRRARLGAHRMDRFLKALGVTDAQRAELQKSREATKSVREDLFAKLKAIREDAKAEAAKGARTDPMRDATR